MSKFCDYVAIAAWDIVFVAVWCVLAWLMRWAASFGNIICMIAIGLVVVACIFIVSVMMFAFVACMEMVDPDDCDMTFVRYSQASLGLSWLIGCIIFGLNLGAMI